jgi:hypothetical protein
VISLLAGFEAPYLMGCIFSLLSFQNPQCLTNNQLLKPLQNSFLTEKEDLPNMSILTKLSIDVIESLNTKINRAKNTPNCSTLGASKSSCAVGLAKENSAGFSNSDNLHAFRLPSC